MKDGSSALTGRIAERVRSLRAERGLSLAQLARKSEVSSSMLSLIERAESSPTAAVLEKLAAGLDVSLPSLFEPASSEAQQERGPVARRHEQITWRDPASGYLRRNVSPANAGSVQLVEIEFPPGARVAFENATREVRLQQQIWLLAGTMDITLGRKRHRLKEGDCLAMELDRPTLFHNPTRKKARYAVVIATELRARRAR